MSTAAAKPRRPKAPKRVPERDRNILFSKLRSVSQVLDAISIAKLGGASEIYASIKAFLAAHDRRKNLGSDAIDPRWSIAADAFLRVPSPLSPEESRGIEGQILKVSIQRSLKAWKAVWA